jgi:hypothetical protein
MVTTRKSQLLASFVVTLATATLLATSAISATPEPVTQPQVEVTAPTTNPIPKTAPASEQKNPVKPEKNDKKKGRLTGMLLTLFAVITGHQGTTR